MPMKYYLIRFWLAISVSFYLFTPYLSRYINEENRYSFHWTREDLFSLLFCIVLLGTLFFLCFVLLYLKGNKFTRRAFEFSYIAIFGIALIGNVSHLVKSIAYHPPTYIVKLGFFTWFLMGGFMIWAVLKNSKKIKIFCITFCFISSPIIPIFTFNALGYKSFISDIGSIPIASETKNQNPRDKMNVYIFIFDEWSYQRSFNNKELIPEFENLKHFADQAMVFHNSTSPWHNTFTSIPSFLFQTRLRFNLKENQIGFQGKEFHPLNKIKNIFHHPRELGFYTAMIGAAMPYGDLLEDSVDFCKAICAYKRFGDGFFNVAKYHLLTAGLLLPAPFLHPERNLIREYFFNRFQVNRIDMTHELFKSIVENQTSSTFAVFHYMIPHFPYIYNRDGHKILFHIYKGTPINYYGNLSYLDRKIGEIISTLKQANKFDNSLVIMTSDHSWREDPSYDKTNWWWRYKKYHVPLFIKMPHQKRSIEIDSKFNTFKLGSFINTYLDGDFTLAEAKYLLSDEKYFSPDPLE
jgi:hypothetical protein